MNKVTIADVALAAGVSKGAVSYALNGKPGISEETRDRVLKVAEELGWRPNPHARSLSSSRASAVGIILARDPKHLHSDTFFNAFFAGVEAVLGQRSHALVLQIVETAEAEIDGYRRLATERRVDGVIVADLVASDPRIPLLIELNLPAVTLNRPKGESPFAAICSDEVTGISKIVEHLVQLGHQNIAHVSGPLAMTHSGTRLQAWRDALAAHALPADTWIESDFTAAGGASATSELLSQDDPPTAIVYANDVMAIAGIARARALGISVPRDLSITGYDDSELSQYMYPPLTTVATDPYLWGRKAAAKLLDIID